MSAGLLNLIVDQGSDWYLYITWEDSDGDPIDNTGYSAKMQMRSLPTSTNAELTLSTVNGGITLGGADGVIELHATAVQTNVSAGFYYYDLELTAPITGTITRVVQGQINLNAEVTR